MDLVEQPIVLKFLFLKGFRYKVAHRELCLVLGERTDLLAHFCKRTDGLVGLRTVIMHVKTKIGQRDPLAPHRWNSTVPGEMSFHVRQGVREVFQYLGAHNESNPQNEPGTLRVLKKMGLT
jgi:hypothetical protein